MAEINWEKIKKEATRLSNIEAIKKELAHLKAEIKKIDVRVHLKPSTKKRLKDFENRYNQLLNSLNQAQRQIDRELTKGLKILKRTKLDSERQLKVIREAVKKQGQIFEQAARDFRKKKTSKNKTTGARKAASKKTTAKRKTAAKVTKKVTQKKTPTRARKKS